MMQKFSLIPISKSTKIKLVDIACFKLTEHDCCTAPVYRKLPRFNYSIV